MKRALGTSWHQSWWLRIIVNRLWKLTMTNFVCITKVLLNTRFVFCKKLNVCRKTAKQLKIVFLQCREKRRQENVQSRNKTMSELMENALEGFSRNYVASGVKKSTSTIPKLIQFWWLVFTSLTSSTNDPQFQQYQHKFQRKRSQFRNGV